MATTTNSPVTTATSHDYRASAQVLSGRLEHPVDQRIHPQAPVSLEDRRDGHFFQRAERYTLEGVVSFKSGYTHVSGSRSRKGQGWITLSTSVVEGLNVLDVITADRVVAQVSTDHPAESGHVPHVTFLGTHFENMRIAGYAAEVELDLGIVGAKPEDDAFYTEDSAFLDRVQRQCETIAFAPGLPCELREQYDEELRLIAEIRRQPKDPGREKPKKLTLQCSLVKSISPVPVAKSFGNLLQIPGFGIVSLGKIDITETVEIKNRPGSNGNAQERYSEIGTLFQVTMGDLQLGCVGQGSVQVTTATANGHNKP